MSLFALTLLFLVQIILRSDGSSLKVPQRRPSPSNIEENNSNLEDFPDIQYPQSNLETQLFFYSGNNVLQPFTDDVKSTFKAIVSESKVKKDPEVTKLVTDSIVQNIPKNLKHHQEKEHMNNATSAETNSANKYLTKTEMENYEENIDEQNGSDGTETVGSILEENNDAISSHNDTNESDLSRRSMEEDEHSQDSYKNNDDTCIAPELLKAATAQTFSSSEAVLPKPPTMADEISEVVDTKDCVVANDCGENCVIDKLHTQHNSKDL